MGLGVARARARGSVRRSGARLGQSGRVVDGDRFVTTYSIAGVVATSLLAALGGAREGTLDGVGQHRPRAQRLLELPA